MSILNMALLFVGLLGIAVFYRDLVANPISAGRALMRFYQLPAEHRRRLEDPSLAGAIVIPERAALASYYELGETVFSMRGAGVDKAREDILRVGQAIQKRLVNLAGGKA